MNSSYSSKVTAVVAGLALAGGLAVAAPQAAYATESVDTSADAQKLEQLVAQQIETTSEQSAVVYEASTTYEAPVAGFTDAANEGEDTGDSNSSAGETNSEQGETTETKQEESADEIKAPESKDEETGKSEEEKTDAAEDTSEAKAANQIVVDEPATQELIANEAEVETQASVTYNKGAWTKVGDKYYWSDDGKTAKKGWLVTSVATGLSGSKSGELQRYWLTSDGSLAISSLIDAKDAGYWAYATKYGYVVRGKYTEGNNIYLADNDGRLENTGWLVTGNYTNGELERYYIESSTHSAVKGRSNSGYAHYTTSEGYVVRGSYDDGNGRVWLADNDGKLESQTGWMVTGKYTNGELQRYYMCSGNYQGSAKSSRFTAKINNKESVFFGQGGVGYVVRGYGFGLNGSDYVYADNEGRLTSSSWLVTGYWTAGELQRYWFDANGTMARNRYISASESKSYAAYATSNGYVVRGAYKTGNKVYLADNDGKLAFSGSSNSGWLVTGTYTNGELQRYYVQGHSAKDGGYTTVGFSTKGYAHYTTANGYVLRGGMTDNGSMYYADNDGKLLKSQWLCTDAFGQGFQRYWMGSDYKVVKNRRISAAETKTYAAYATKDGYVVRGTYDDGNGRVWLADNDGKLESRTGWLVTGKYTNGELQRYYMNSGDYQGSAKSSFFTVDGKNYFGIGGVGYVVRGKYKLGLSKAVTVGKSSITSGVIVANNDGVLLTDSVSAVVKAATSSSSGGWYVGNALDSDFQRYWFFKASDGHVYAAVGKFTFNNDDYYYGRDDQGYVVRGSYIAPDGNGYYADNDGVLYKTGWIKNGSSWTYLYIDGTQKTFTNAAYSAWQKIKSWTSKTEWLICLDQANFRTVVFKGSANNWVPMEDWLCNVGIEKTTSNDHYNATVKGVYSIIKKGTMMGNDPDYYYWSEFFVPSGYTGQGMRFHSTGYYRRYGTDITNPANRGAQIDHVTGGKSTHGCVRLAIGNSYYIWKNCPIGTKVYSYE